MKSSLRRALAQRELVVGTWVKLPLTEVVELMALAGFDFIVIDLEHSAMSVESAFRQIGVARLAGLGAIVRVANLDGGVAQRMLDAGAEGVMLPHIDTPEEARAAVAALRFPPLGQRGMGPTSRAGGWGLQNREEYVRFGQEEVLLIAQIESAVAVAHAAEIAAVVGIDALLVGAADLSASEGRQESDPEILSLIDRAVQAAHVSEVPIGNSGGATLAAVQRAVEAGFGFTMLSNDASLLGSAASAAVQAARTVNTAGDSRREEHE